MKVRCMDNTDFKMCLTIGKIYEVCDFDEYGDNSFISIKDDSGSEGAYLKSRFKFVDGNAVTLDSISKYIKGGLFIGTS